MRAVCRIGTDWLILRVRTWAVTIAIVVALAGLGLSAESALAACTATRVATTATFTCDNTNDSTTFDQSGGLLRNNRRAKGDLTFNSEFDFDSGVGGDQTLATDATSTVNFNTGTGNDEVIIGTAAAASATSRVWRAAPPTTP